MWYNSGNRPQYTWKIILAALAIVLVIAVVIIILFVTGVLPPTTNDTFFLRNKNESDDEKNSSKGMSPFHIDIRFIHPVSTQISQIFNTAKSRWEQIITNDEDTIVTIKEGQVLCGIQINKTEVVDDLIIFVKVAHIDGVGNVLANAGPCGLDSRGRVRAGVMNFDLADLERLIAHGRATTVVKHEMGHVLGFGILWESRQLLGRSGANSELEYQGKEGNIGNEQIGFKGKAKVEEDGGDGTAKTHWKESVYGRELMTGFIGDDDSAPISLLTVRSFRDLGYSVNLASADSFSADDTTKSQLRGSSTSPTSSSEEDSNQDIHVTDDDDQLAFGNDVLDSPRVSLPTFPKTMSTSTSPAPSSSNEIVP